MIFKSKNTKEPTCFESPKEASSKNATMPNFQELWVVKPVEIKTILGKWSSSFSKKMWASMVGRLRTCFN